VKSFIQSKIEKRKAKIERSPNAACEVISSIENGKAKIEKRTIAKRSL
jgi:hypothetical protein